MKIKTMRFKKRYIAIGLIGLEVVSIPVSAQIIDKVAFSVPQKVISVPFPSEAGVTKFLVSSNAPFAVISENAIGEFQVNVQVSGQVNGNAFGSNAQLPGAESSCAAQTAASPTKVYEAVRKTAAQPGDVLTQAVIVQIRYDAEISPDFNIITQDKAKRISSAAACETTLS
ncbi:MAG: hypothetical protein ABJN69_17825 [Hellea sp.]